VGLTDAKYRDVGSVQGLTVNDAFVLVPKWNASAAISKEFMLGNGDRITPRFDWSYHSGTYTNANGVPTPELYQPAYSCSTHPSGGSIARSASLLAWII
jgi:hypothetical protein